MSKEELKERLKELNYFKNKLIDLDNSIYFEKNINEIERKINIVNKKILELR